MKQRLIGREKRYWASAYRRGSFWLEKRKNSENWYIFSYNRQKRQYEYKSSKTDNLEAAKEALDRIFLAATDQAPNFCTKCGQKLADGSVYLLKQAIADYNIEVSPNRASCVTIKSRLQHVLNYIDLELQRPNLTCEEAATQQFVNGLRTWLQNQPVNWLNGSGEVTKSRPRTRSAVEESAHQLRAVLNHALKMQRSNARPSFKALSRKVVSPPVRIRISVDMLAEMVSYAAEYEKRSGLHRFLVASICTAARPDAIYDMSVASHRHQWDKMEGFFDLNPLGREQTKKYRPVIPVVPALRSLLEEAERNSPEGWVIHYRGSRVTRVRSAWRTMMRHLGHPAHPHWGSYLIRRSVATLLRQKGANPWDVEGMLGHRLARTTETYSFDRLFVTARQAIEDILTDIERIAPGALQGNCRENAVDRHYPQANGWIKTLKI